MKVWDNLRVWFVVVLIMLMGAAITAIVFFFKRKIREEGDRRASDEAHDEEKQVLRAIIKLIPPQGVMCDQSVQNISEFPMSTKAITLLTPRREPVNLNTLGNLQKLE
jgi:hypothetical protein